MNVRKLFELQCLEQDLDVATRTLAEHKTRLGESKALITCRTRRDAAAASLKELQHHQKEIENGITDISARMTVTHEQLYSGRIKNSRELQNLQSEYDMFKSQRDQLEEKDLALMEQIEEARNESGSLETELTAVTQEWQQEQERLKSAIDGLVGRIDELSNQQSELEKQIDAEAMTLYRQMRQTHGWGIARVEQGICGRCRLNLSSAALQRVRSAAAVHCSSCGSLLFFDW